MLGELVKRLWELGSVTRFAMLLQLVVVAACVAAGVIATRRRATTRARVNASLSCALVVALGWSVWVYAQSTNAAQLQHVCQTVGAADKASLRLAIALGGILYTTVAAQLSIAVLALSVLVLAVVYRLRYSGPAAKAIQAGLLAAAPLLLGLLLVFSAVMHATSLGIKGLAEMAFTPPADKARVALEAAQAAVPVLATARTLLAIALLATAPVALWAGRRAHALGYRARAPQLMAASTLALLGVVCLVVGRLAHVHALLAR